MQRLSGRFPEVVIYKNRTTGGPLPRYQSSSYILSSITHSKQTDQRMRQVVAYKRLKTMENHYPSGPKSGRGRLQEVVVY